MDPSEFTANAILDALLATLAVGALLTPLVLLCATAFLDLCDALLYEEEWPLRARLSSGLRAGISVTGWVLAGKLMLLSPWQTSEPLQALGALVLAWGALLVVLGATIRELWRLWEAFAGSDATRWLEDRWFHLSRRLRSERPPAGPTPGPTNGSDDYDFAAVHRQYTGVALEDGSVREDLRGCSRRCPGAPGDAEPRSRRWLNRPDSEADDEYDC